MVGNKRSIAAAFCLLAGGMLWTASAFAGENDEYISSLPQQKIDLIEQNVVNALTSGIPGMQADGAQLVRDLKGIRPEQMFASCVVPLMGILKDEEGETPARILAALALNELESSRGDFAISRTAQFTSDARLKYVCGWLAYEKKVGKHSEDKEIASYEPIPEGDQ
jgi:hypothetical protein